MVEIKRANPHRRADVLEQRSSRWSAANERDVALRGDERVESVEQNADGGGEAEAFGSAPGTVEQQRARRLQLFRQRRLLADRRAIGRLQVGFRVEHRRDRAEIDR